MTMSRIAKIEMLADNYTELTAINGIKEFNVRHTEFSDITCMEMFWLASEIGDFSVGDARLQYFSDITHT